MPEKQVATRVDEETKRRVRVAAAKRDMDMADWLRESIHEKLDRDAESEDSTDSEDVSA